MGPITFCRTPTRVRRPLLSGRRHGPRGCSHCSPPASSACGLNEHRSGSPGPPRSMRGACEPSLVRTTPRAPVRSVTACRPSLHRSRSCEDSLSTRSRSRVRIASVYWRKRLGIMNMFGGLTSERGISVHSSTQRTSISNHEHVQCMRGTAEGTRHAKTAHARHAERVHAATHPHG